MKAVDGSGGWSNTEEVEYNEGRIAGEELDWVEGDGDSGQQED